MSQAATAQLGHLIRQDTCPGLPIVVTGRRCTGKTTAVKAAVEESRCVSTYVNCAAGVTSLRMLFEAVLEQLTRPDVGLKRGKEGHWKGPGPQDLLNHHVSLGLPASQSPPLPLAASGASRVRRRQQHCTSWASFYRQLVQLLSNSRSAKVCLVFDNVEYLANSSGDSSETHTLSRMLQLPHLLSGDALWDSSLGDFVLCPILISSRHNLLADIPSDVQRVSVSFPPLSPEQCCRVVGGDGRSPHSCKVGQNHAGSRQHTEEMSFGGDLAGCSSSHEGRSVCSEVQVWVEPHVKRMRLALEDHIESIMSVFGRTTCDTHELRRVTRGLWSSNRAVVSSQATGNNSRECLLPETGAPEGEGTFGKRLAFRKRKMWDRRGRTAAAAAAAPAAGSVVAKLGAKGAVSTGVKRVFDLSQPELARLMINALYKVDLTPAGLQQQQPARTSSSVSSRSPSSSRAQCFPRFSQFLLVSSYLAGRNPRDSSVDKALFTPHHGGKKKKRRSGVGLAASGTQGHTGKSNETGAAALGSGGNATLRPGGFAFSLERLLSIFNSLLSFHYTERTGNVDLPHHIRHLMGRKLLSLALVQASWDLGQLRFVSHVDHSLALSIADRLHIPLSSYSI